MSSTQTISSTAAKSPVAQEDKRVLVAMSGGVDSSVAAALLKTQGYDVIGVHMQLWDHGDKNLERLGGRCCSLVDANDARRVCDRLDIPYYVINTQDIFKYRVVDYFVHEYLQRRTPNPCVMCNNEIKFNYLFQKADELGCKMVATGHYAQINRDILTGKGRLVKAIDDDKDQSYFLFGMTQKALQRTMMPIGGLSKKMVRRLALQFDLNVADKKDSQEICFIGTEGYKDFIKSNTTAEFRPGGMVRLEDGTVIGEHDGLYRYTIGQRSGLNITNKEHQDKYYVIEFEAEKNAIVVGPEEKLFHDQLIVSDVNWLQEVDPVRNVKCSAKIRSRQTESPCEIITFENEYCHVKFEKPQRAITPGQAIVFYRGSEVIGGGFIEKVIKPEEE